MNGPPRARAAVCQLDITTDRITRITNWLPNYTMLPHMLIGSASSKEIPNI
jgi:hypothetical protein